jgi:hypothetical protein
MGTKYARVVARLEKMITSRLPKSGILAFVLLTVFYAQKVGAQNGVFTSGTITSIDSTNGGAVPVGVDIGSSFSFLVTYDSTMPPSLLTDTFAQYNLPGPPAISLVALFLGPSFGFATEAPYTITVFRTLGGDGLTITWPGFGIGGVPDAGNAMVHLTTSHGLISSLSLPTTGLPCISAFSQKDFSITLVNGDAQSVVHGRVDNVVPCEPVCQVQVPALSQFGPHGFTTPLTPWGSNQYDHLTSDRSGALTIGRAGCALTSLTMALNFVGTSWDPGSLNTVLTGVLGAYSPSPDGVHGGKINWLPATVAANGGLTKALHFDDLGGFVDSDVDLNAAEKAVEDELCAQIPHPVIVGVRSPKTGIYDLQHGPGHFVLITGEIINPDGTKAFRINDPARYSTILGSSGGQSFYTNAQGNPEFSTRGIVNDPEDLSGLSITVDANASIVVTDPTGLRTGFDSATGSAVQNISHSAAFVDSLDDDVTGVVDTAPVRSVLVNSPVSGNYEISITGLTVGQYTLSATVISTDGTIQNQIQIPGISDLESNASVQLTISLETGSNPKASVKATFASTLADINNGLLLGFIDSQGIANSLGKKIENAANAAGLQRANALNAFINEVNAQSGKHITGTVPQILLQDAHSLISQ